MINAVRVDNTVHLKKIMMEKYKEFRERLRRRGCPDLFSLGAVELLYEVETQDPIIYQIKKFKNFFRVVSVHRG